MLRYYKLFDMLNRRGMKKTSLLRVISSPTLAKLSRGDNVQTEVIDKICLFLKCQPSDIMECIFDESNEPGHEVYYKYVKTGDEEEIVEECTTMPAELINDVLEKEDAKEEKRIMG